MQSFGTICPHYRYRVVHCAITYMRAWFYVVKATHAKTKLFGGLSYEQIRRYNNSPPYVTARWLPQQIPPLNFREFFTKKHSIMNMEIFALHLVLRFSCSNQPSQKFKCANLLFFCLGQYKESQNCGCKNKQNSSKSTKRQTLMTRKFSCL